MAKSKKSTAKSEGKKTSAPQDSAPEENVNAPEATAEAPQPEAQVDERRIKRGDHLFSLIQNAVSYGQRAFPDSPAVKALQKIKRVEIK